MVVRVPRSLARMRLVHLYLMGYAILVLDALVALRSAEDP